MSEAASFLEAPDDGYSRLLSTDPSDPNWIVAAKEAIADGSIWSHVSTLEDVRKRIAKLQSE